MGTTHRKESSSIVSAICSNCGRMVFDKEYYDPKGNAAVKFIVCKKCTRKKEVTRPLCQFCSKPSSCWKLGRYWVCAPCGVSLDIMRTDGILEKTKTERCGGPAPGTRKSKF